MKKTKKKTKLQKWKRIKILKAKAETVFHHWIRIRDDYICYTCGLHGDIYNMQAGHFQHSSSDLDERNLHCQCVRCNKWLSGNLDVYTVKMIEQYGMEVVKELQRLKGIPRKYTEQELNEVIEKYGKQ